MLIHLHTSPHLQALGVGTWVELLGATFQLPVSEVYVLTEASWASVHGAEAHPVPSHNVQGEGVAVEPGLLVVLPRTQARVI